MNENELKSVILNKVYDKFKVTGVQEMPEELDYTTGLITKDKLQYPAHRGEYILHVILEHTETKSQKIVKADEFCKIYGIRRKNII